MGDLMDAAPAEYRGHGTDHETNRPHLTAVPTIETDPADVAEFHRYVVAVVAGRWLADHLPNRLHAEDCQLIRCVFTWCENYDADASGSVGSLCPRCRCPRPGDYDAFELADSLLTMLRGES